MPMTIGELQAMLKDYRQIYGPQVKVLTTTWDGEETCYLSPTVILRANPNPEEAESNPVVLVLV